jgi:MAD (mothers against decapentaplegic) interacting protein
LNYENFSHSKELSHNKEVDEEIEKNKLISSLLEKAKWNTELSQEPHDYDIDSTSTEEEISDEVLYVSIDQKTDSNKDLSDNSNVSSNSHQIEIKLLPSNSLQLINEEKDLAINETQSVIKSEQINVTENSVNPTVNQVSDISSDLNQILPESDKIDANESKECNVSENANELSEQIFVEMKSDSDTNNDSLTEDSDNKCETNSIENNINNPSNVVKFSDIEVNIDDLTEHDIDEYLRELNEYESNECNALNINSNDNTVEASDVTQDELIKTNLDLSSISQSTSSASNEENDEIQDFSEYDISSQNNISVQSFKTENNICDDNLNESVKHSDDNIPTKIIRPNTLPIPTNAIPVNTIANGEILTNNEIDDRNDEPNDNFRENIEYMGQNLANGLSEDEQMLGKVKPFWIPDQETQMCMHCDLKFTVLKRRHHCRYLFILYIVLICFYI